MFGCTRRRHHRRHDHRCRPRLSRTQSSPLTYHPFHSSFHFPGSPKAPPQPPRAPCQQRGSAPQMNPVIPGAAPALAAAAAEAAVQEVVVDPSHETLHAVRLASAAAAAESAVHYGSAARACAHEPSTLSPSRPCRSTDQLAGRSTASRNEPTEPDLRPSSRPPQRPRKTKATSTFGDKTELIRIYDSGVHTWRSL